MTLAIAAFDRSPDRGSVKGLRQFLNAELQRAWMEGEAKLRDTDERSESPRTAVQI